MFYVYADGESIFSPLDDSLAIFSPKVTLELGKSGSFQFSIPKSNEYYNSIEQLKTSIIVEIDNTEIFRGRVLTITRGFSNIKNVYCEGILSYLVDSVQKANRFNGKAKDLYEKILRRHNAMVDSSKRFSIELGSFGVENAAVVIPGKKEEGDKYFGENKYEQAIIESIVDEWQTTYDYINKIFIDYLGGYLVAKHDFASDKNYIDYISNETFDSLVETAELEDKADFEIEFGVNMLDLSEEINAEDMFTVLVPLGDGDEDELTIKNATNKYSDSSIELVEVNGKQIGIADRVLKEQYGSIVKTHVFDNVNNPNTLFSNGVNYIKRKKHIPITYAVKAVDLHFINGASSQMQIGDVVKVTSSPHSIIRYLLCTKIEYDLSNPGNTVYTFGNPEQTLTERYKRDKDKNKNDSDHNRDRSAKGGGGAAGAAKDDATEEAKRGLNEFKQYANDTYATQELLNQFVTDSTKALNEFKQYSNDTYATQELLNQFVTDSTKALNEFKQYSNDTYATQELLNQFVTDSTKALNEFKQYSNDTYATQELLNQFVTDSTKALNEFKQYSNDTYATQSLLNEYKNGAAEALNEFKQYSNDTYATQSLLNEYKNGAAEALNKFEQYANGTYATQSLLNEYKNGAAEALNKFEQYANGTYATQSLLNEYKNGAAEALNKFEQYANGTYATQSLLNEYKNGAAEALNKFEQYANGTYATQSLLNEYKNGAAEALNKFEQYANSTYATQSLLNEYKNGAAEALNKFEQYANGTYATQSLLNEYKNGAAEALNKFEQYANEEYAKTSIFSTFEKNTNKSLASIDLLASKLESVIKLTTNYDKITFNDDGTINKKSVSAAGIKITSDALKSAINSTTDFGEYVDGKLLHSTASIHQLATKLESVIKLTTNYDKIRFNDDGTINKKSVSAAGIKITSDALKSAINSTTDFGEYVDGKLLHSTASIHQLATKLESVIKLTTNYDKIRFNDDGTINKKSVSAAGIKITSDALKSAINSTTDFGEYVDGKLLHSTASIHQLATKLESVIKLTTNYDKIRFNDDGTINKKSVSAAGIKITSDALKSAINSTTDFGEYVDGKLLHSTASIKQISDRNKSKISLIASFNTETDSATGEITIKSIKKLKKDFTTAIESEINITADNVTVKAAKDILLKGQDVVIDAVFKAEGQAVFKRDVLFKNIISTDTDVSATFNGNVSCVKDFGVSGDTSLNGKVSVKNKGDLTVNGKTVVTTETIESEIKKVVTSTYVRQALRGSDDMGTYLRKQIGCTDSRGGAVALSTYISSHSAKAHTHTFSFGHTHNVTVSGTSYTTGGASKYSGTTGSGS